MRSVVVSVLVFSLAVVLAGLPVHAGSASTGWPNLDDAVIRPGVHLNIGSNQCTANFVFSSPDNATLYLGMAAHCAALGGATQTNGCETTSLPIGTPVAITGASRPGIMAYSSWLTMQANSEFDSFTCAFNDFALVRIDPADRGLVHPAMIHYGGPTTLVGVPQIGDRVLTLGSSDTRPNGDELDRREGRVVSSGGSGWSTTIFTATPGIPGDSGSGVMTAEGGAFGSLATVSLAPVPASNGVTNLVKALPYAAAAGVNVQLATWPLLAPGIQPI